MSLLSLLPRESPAPIVLRFPLFDLDLVDFHDLTPIGVETVLSTPIAPGTRQFLEIVTANGGVVVADVLAVQCRPTSTRPDDWTFEVTWEFVGDEEFDGRLRALLDAAALESVNDVWH